MRRSIITLLALALAACGSERPLVLDDGGSDGSLAPDVFEPPVDGGEDVVPLPDGDVPDAAFCLSFDAPDDFGVDDDCDGAEGTRERSIYVSNDGNDTFAGSPQYPVKTFARALELLERTPSRTYVFVASSADPYDAAGVGELLERGASIYGSLSPLRDWSRPDGTETTLNTTIRVDGDGIRAHVTAPRVELAYLRIVSRRTTNQLHSVGLRLTGQGTVDLAYVDVVTDDAGDGADGADGIDAPPANPGEVNWADEEGTTYFQPERRRGGAGGAVQVCPGLTANQSQVTRGGNGGRGKPYPSDGPLDGEPGGGGAAGGARGTNDSRSGKNGQNGGHGSRGQDAEPVTTEDWGVVDAHVTWLDTGLATHGTPGGGGGGGGGAQTNGAGCLDNRAPGGTGGGAGGCNGSAGQNGVSGGFSVGILADGAPPTLHRVRIQTGRGGHGGNAGRGGEGANGGTSPASISVYCTNYTGGKGGVGGNGGDGGHGAPGAGGWSIGILSASPIADLEGVSITTGAAGLPGTPVPGGPASDPGQAVEVLVP